MLELTKPQKLIYDMEKFAGGSIATVCGSIVIKGEKDIETLSNAANELYRLNDALRIKITETDGVPYQTITEYKEQEINMLRFKDKAELNSYAENYAKEPMDFYGSLCHMQIIVLDNAYGILVKLHHIISDAWTLALIGSQFNSILKSETPDVYSYIDYISSEQKYLEGKRYQKDKGYYIEQFKKCDETTYLSDKQVQSYIADRKTFVVDKEKTAKITDYVNENNTSLFMLLMTALGVYINRIKMNQEKFYVGTAVLNRNGLAEQNTMGMFINTVPVLFDLENDSTFKENLDKFSENMMTMLRHQKFNYGDVLKELRSEFNFSGNLYDVMLSYQNAKVVGMEDDFESSWYHCGMQTESLQMHIDDRDSKGILKIHYDYQIEKFSEKEIKRMHEHIFNLLFDAINEDKKITTINILSEEEKNTLLYDFNDTKADYPKDKCVHQLFEEQVQKTPDKNAVIACDKTLTYDELNRLSNRIANSLIEKGIKANDIVAFALPRESSLIAVMFGILKSGAAYMPIDPDYPQDRIDYMLEDSSAKFYITESNLNEFISDNEDNPNVEMTSDNYCYCIYTSGSTGKPKGTLLYHKGIVNLITNLAIYHDISIVNTIGFATTITFDVATQEILTALLNGFVGVLLPERKASSPDKIISIMQKNKIDMIYATPSYFDMLTSKKEWALQILNQLNTVVLAGEKFYLNSVVNELCQECDITFENQYGPAETHVVSCSHIFFHTEKNISHLENLSETEKNVLLYDFNDTKVDYSKDKCVHQLFEEQVLKTPDKTAVIACDKTLTYDELNKLSNKIANSLIQKGVKANDIIAFALPRESSLIAVMFGILKSGAAYMPIDPDYPQDRIDYMLEDSGAKFFITEENINNFISTNEENPMICVSPDSYYCALHTSGSTGTPKMSLLYHKSIMNFLYANTKFYDNVDTVVSATIITFDAFIMDSVLATSYGKPLYLMSNDEMYNQNKFEKVFKNISKAMFFSTPTKLKSYIDNSTNKEFVKNIKSFVLGGEIFTEDLFDLINENTDNSNIYNIYGPTETTICVVVDELKNHDITIGKPIANTQIYIVDKYNNLMPIGQIGELCIAGDGVGAGYLNRSELTAEKFIDNPFGEGKLYKTGDLAYWREDGNIAYVGRNDFQVKIRGLRIELGEIESAIDSVDGISQAVVVVRKDTNGRQLICAFYTEHSTVDVAKIKSAISSKLPKYMMPHIFTALEEMPLTTSGKINRKTLSEVDLTNISNDTEYVVPNTEKETILCHTIENILNAEKVGTADNFFDLGGDSLKAIELISKLESKGYKTTVKTVFDCETIKELAEQLEQAEAEITPFEWVGDIPATDAQMRVYTAQSMQENSTLYNVPYCFKTDDLDVDRLQNAVNKLIERHEILRTHFENKDGHIIQVINETASIQVERLSSDNILDFIKPFDLEKAPLIRVGYYENTVMVDIHHIITDGSSMPVFFNELNELYMGRTLDNTPVQYKEFAVQTQDHTNSEKYWLSVFDDEVPVLEINTDSPRGNKQTHNGSALYDTIDSDLHNKIKDKCKELNITPYAFYMSGFNILLSKFSGCEDIVVGMPISGRESKFLNTMGMFVNTITLRNKPIGTKSVSEFLTEVKENSINAIANQNYPFGELIKKLNIDAQNRNPLFDVMFAYQSEEMTDIVFGDIKAELLTIPITTSKYDLTLNVMPRENDVVLMAEYCTDLYKESIMKRIINSFKQVLSNMLDTSAKVKDIDVLSKQEKNTLLYDFNDTKADYPKDKCVHQLFEEQVVKTPDKTAIIACDKTLTYDELNKLSNRIANSLIEKGVKANDIVAFALPRESSLIAVMFGVLKSGAAYLPIDLDFPQDRVEYMIADSGSKFYITESNLQDFISDNEENPNIEMTSDNYCYCIYTSGTTGNPKGTIIKHRNLINFCNNNSNNYQSCMINQGTRLVSTFKCCFDAFGVDYALFLLNGLSLVLANDYEMTHAEDLARLIKKHNVDVIHSTPSTIKAFCGNEKYVEAIKKAKIIMVAAENFTPDLYEFLQNHTSAKFFNGYGPSETTIGVSFGEINSTDITIGKPIANTQIYILDKYNNPMPLGQIGELCIAGDGVGAGYLNRPELTAEKFIDNPFGNGKMYKTGDHAYWREDGNIAYVGRNDFQVKIRGLRIELGEIESAIDSVDGISQAVVIVRKDANGRQLICAFYTEHSTVDVAEIKSAISSKLPKYMMPHIFTVLSEMPLTSSGKINRKALPEVDLTNTNADAEYVKPENKLQQEIASVMEKVLNYSPVGLNDDFFDLGGDSLKAIEFVSKAHSEGIYFNLQAVFDNPTVAKLYDYIKNGDKQAVSYNQADFDKYIPLLENNKVECVELPQKSALGNVFITGSTGFLGSHIIDELLTNGADKLYCLVRNDEQRLYDMLSFYFGDKYKDDRRIIPVIGDLEHLADVKVEDNIDLVIHTAASVKHYGSYQYFYDMNVGGTLNAIEFSKNYNAKLIHISTLSVSGNAMLDVAESFKSETELFFDETTLFMGQPLENVYARSKFEAEKAVLDAMLSGLDANIIRVGNLTNRVSDAKFQKNHESNAFLNRFKAVLELKVFPEYLMSLYAEFSPVDDTAKGIVKIAKHFNNKHTVFNLNSYKPLYFNRFVEILEKLGIEMNIVDGKTFIDKIKLPGSEEMYEALINDMDENGNLVYDSNIRILNDFTKEYMKLLGFEWSEIDFEYMKRYVEYFREIGYLEV